MRWDLSFSNLQHCNSSFFFFFIKLLSIIQESSQCPFRNIIASGLNHSEASSQKKYMATEKISYLMGVRVKLEASAHNSRWNFLLSNYISSAIFVVSLTMYSWIPRIKKVHLSRYCTVRRNKGSSVSRKLTAKSTTKPCP